MANPFVKITPDPLWLNADGIPDAMSARRPVSAGVDGAPGVVRRADFATTFNAGMGITVTGGEAFVKGTNVTNQPMVVPRLTISQSMRLLLRVRHVSIRSCYVSSMTRMTALVCLKDALRYLKVYHRLQQT